MIHKKLEITFSLNKNKNRIESKGGGKDVSLVVQNRMKTGEEWKSRSSLYPDRSLGRLQTIQNRLLYFI